MGTATAPIENARAPGPEWRARLAMGWLGLVAPLLIVSLAALSLTRDRDLADLFLLRQDLVVLAATAAFVLALRFAPASRAAWGEAVCALMAAQARPLSIASAAFAALAAVVGWFMVCRGYALSMDEFMAGFDAAILRRGQTTATLAPEWRGFLTPLQPQFMISAADASRWSSSYLPGNAAVRALFSLAGAPWLAGALWAALSIAATYAVARRLWPERRDAAAVAVVLLTTSSQFLFIAMTPYAMSAHLALNMAWLWLYLREDRWGDLGALAVGLLATGLHQLVFHPLFVAPFIIGLWLSRRWGRALLFTAGYGAIGLLWVLYWKLVLPTAPVQPGQGGGVWGLFAQVAGLLAKNDLNGIGWMAKNLVRFVAWQNPLMIALALGAAVAAARSEATLRALLAGAALTVLAAGLLMPFQGHGWGYRYLHGVLGGLALVAAYGWIGLTDPAHPERRGAAGAALTLAAAFSLLCIAPIRAQQIRAFIAPYAAADKLIRAIPADVVLIDPTGLFYAADLVRNDPWLDGAPKRMDLTMMTAGQVAQVCGRYRVSLFDKVSAAGAGIEAVSGAPTAQVTARRSELALLGCGRR